VAEAIFLNFVVGQAGCRRILLVTIKEAQWSRQAPHQNRPSKPRVFVDLGSILGISQDLHKLRQLLGAPAIIEPMISQAPPLDPALAAAQVTVAMTRVDRVRQQLFSVEQHRLVRLLVERVIITPANLELRLRPGGVGNFAADARQMEEEVA